MELFFDLVYVFAITQLSEYPRRAPDRARCRCRRWSCSSPCGGRGTTPRGRPTGSIRTRRRVALLMLVLMGISLVMSAAIPEAFGARGLAFAVAYVAIQVLRSGFMVAALRGQTMGRNYAQLLAWSAIAGVVWIAGAFAHGDARLWLWIARARARPRRPAARLPAPGHRRYPDRGSGPLPAATWPNDAARAPDRARRIGPSRRRDVRGRARGAGVDIAFVVGFVATASLWASTSCDQPSRGRGRSRARDQAARLRVVRPTPTRTRSWSPA